MALRYKYLFGPVHSRRMGLSLGIDLVPAKTCSFNCPFCQAGVTTCLTIRRRAYVPVRKVIAEFDAWLRQGGRADFITLAGAGEPTLHTGFGDILKTIHERCRFKTALLSNGSLFAVPAVSKAALAADLVKVSLSAWDQASFRRINRGAPALAFNRIVDGLMRFRRLYRGILWLEVFVVAGLNDRAAAMRKIAVLARAIRPDQVQLNTVVRPPAEHDVAGVPASRLRRLARWFRPLPVQVIAHAPPRLRHPPSVAEAAFRVTLQVPDVRIVDMARRHPSTAADVAASLGISRAAAQQACARLARAGHITAFRCGSIVIYR